MLALGSEGDTLGDSRLHVVLHEVVARTPARLSVVHLQYLEYARVFLGTIFADVDNQEVLRRADGIVTIGYTYGPATTFTRQGIDLVEYTDVLLTLLFKIGCGTGHPSRVEGGRGQQLSLRHIAQFVLPATIASTLRRLIAHTDILAVGRQRDTTHAFTVCQVVNHIGMAGRGG